MVNKNVFNDIICDYAIARPGYPVELFKDMIEYSMTGLELGEKQVEYLLGETSYSTRCQIIYGKKVILKGR